MGRKLTAVYVFFSIALFIALFVLFGVRVSDIRKSNIRKIGDGFERIRETVESTYRLRESFDTPDFRDAVDRVFAGEKRLQILVVSSYDTGIQYIRARRAGDISTAVDDLGALKGVPRFSYNGFSRTKIASSITIPRKNSFIVEGVYRVIGEEELYPPLRDTVIVLVVFSVMTSIFTILLKLFGPREQAREKIAMPAGGDAGRSAGGRPSSPPPSECLFSPSGASWQHHLEKRLTLELERSAFNEQDLSLVLMKFPGLSRKDADHPAIARDLQGKIAFEDLVFEFDEDGYAVVLPNSSLDQSIGLVKNFLNTLSPEILARRPRPLCGLTSRNGRIVDGARLIIEGRKALEKTAADDTGGIVGFRPDPGKYRKYVSDRGAPREA